MITKRFFCRLASLFALIMISLLMQSCEKLKEDPLYVGTWEYTDKIYSGDLVFNTTRTLILSKSSFQEIYTIKRDNSSEVITILATKGDLQVNNSTMAFTLKAVGQCLKDAQEKCTSAVEWFNKGSETYDSYVQFFAESYEAEFEADEDYLWLVRDLNDDGDVEEVGEEIEFDRI
jgi:hypothetical protein